MKLGFLLLCTLIIYDNNTLYCHIKEFSLSSFPENYILLGKKKEPQHVKPTKEYIPLSVFIILEDEYSLGLLNWNEKHILLELTWWFLFSLVSYKLNDAGCIFMLIYFKMVPGAKKASINASLVFQIQFDVIYFKYMWTEKDNAKCIF